MPPAAAATTTTISAMRLWPSKLPIALIIIKPSSATDITIMATSVAARWTFTRLA